MLLSEQEGERREVREAVGLAWQSLEKGNKESVLECTGNDSEK